MHRLASWQRSAVAGQLANRPACKGLALTGQPVKQRLARLALAVLLWLIPPVQDQVNNMTSVTSSEHLTALSHVKTSEDMRSLQGLHSSAQKVYEFYTANRSKDCRAVASASKTC
jgi:hypothetical protein